MKVKGLYSVVLLFCLMSCFKVKFNMGTVSPVVSPIDDLNTPFDDMNMDISRKYRGDGFDFVYSSSFVGHGKYFSLISKQMGVSFETIDGRVKISTSNYNSHFQASPHLDTHRFVLQVNNTCNQRGPYLWQDTNHNRILLYSSDCDGHASLFMHKEDLESVNGRVEPMALRLLDDNSNEMYPSFYGNNFIKSLSRSQSDYNNSEYKNPEKLIFTSDKDGVFDIYEINIPQDMDPVTFLQSSSFPKVKKLSINSSSNDHAPSVFGDMLVFASDRPGGLGGYDLYWSKHVNGNWTEPVNFGAGINSSSDEFRPVIYDNENLFTNKLLVFSSDRPGGKGGFDLYHVGVSR